MDDVFDINDTHLGGSAPTIEGADGINEENDIFPFASEEWHESTDTTSATPQLFTRKQVKNEKLECLIKDRYIE